MLRKQDGIIFHKLKNNSMLLGIKERIVLQNVLPAEANYVTYKIIQDLRNELSFTEQEIKDHNIIANESGVSWDPASEKPKEINIGKKAKEIIEAELQKLDAQNKINIDTASLYEKFVID